MMLYSKIFNSVWTRSIHITYVEGARAKVPKQNQNCLIKETTAFKVFIADVCLFKGMKQLSTQLTLSLVLKTLSSNCCCCCCCCLGIAPRAKMLRISAWLLQPNW